MHISRITRRAGIAALVLVAGCQSLEVPNPNAPDAERALSDPAAIEALAGGTLRTLFNTYYGVSATGPLTTQARTLSASWNNYNMNFYSSVDTTSSAAEANSNRNARGWVNDPASSRRTSIEHFWEGYYSAASSARDVLVAIRVNNVAFPDPVAEARAEAVAELVLGATLGQIALNYDKGYIIDETSDLTALAYSTREQVRDAAVAKLINAAALASATSFNTPAAWTGGNVLSNTTLAQFANTLAAMTLAYYPRNDTENGTEVNWAQVATLAAAGLQSDIVFIGDGCASFCPELPSWGNDIFTMRVHTRVANLIDPATQVHPYPVGGNPQPNATDNRMGDGSYGTAGMVDDFGNVPVTANAGTDFAWSGYEAFFPTRGQYHQSSIGHIRYDLSGTQSPGGIWGANGPMPFVPRIQNDLIRAEALLRSGGSAVTAATLINNTRVTRGGLTAALAAEPTATLLGYLQYENEIELLSLGASTFYHRRRVANGLIVGTPREMPVPAKELGVKNEALYTWGGATPNSPTP